jgi:membrane-associated phospholipid phosphatase
MIGDARPGRPAQTALRAIAATLLYTFACVLLLVFGPAFEGLFFAYSAGVACLVVPAVALRRGHGVLAAAALGLLIPGLMYAALLRAHTIAIPAVDARLAAMDRALTGWPDGAWMAWGFAHRRVLLALKLVYLALMIPLVAVWCRRGLVAGPIVALVLGGLLASPLYSLAPAAGPWVARVPPAVAEHAWGNAFPSFHVAFALIWLWAAWPLGPGWRWTVGAFAALTAASTLVIGEHYAVDLIGSPAAAAACAWIVERRWRRGALMLALLVGWALAVRSGAAWLTTPELLWPAAILTIAAPVAMRPLRGSAAAVSPAADAAL